jgi:ATP-binding cassette, subfamily C, bacterial LapB
MAAEPSYIHSANQETFKSNQGDALLTSFSLLLQHYGITKSEEVLVAGLPIKERITPELLIRVADSNGCRATVKQRGLQEISDLLLPVLLELRDQQACVFLKRLDDKRAVVLLPETGMQEIVVDLADLRDEYAGHCYFVKPDLKPDERSGIEVKTAPGHWFWSTLWRYKSYYLEAGLAALLINILALAGTFFTMNVYDRVISNQAYVTLWTLAIGVTIALTFEFVARILRGWLIDNAGKKADLVLGAKVFRQALMSRLEYRAASAGSFANNLREFESLRDFVTSLTLVAITDLPFLFLFIWVISLIAGPLFWVPLLAIPVMVIVAGLAQFPLSRYVNENMRESSMKHGLLVEAVEGGETVKALRAEGFMQGKYEMSSAVTARTAMKSRLVTSFVLNFAYVVQSLCTVIMVVWGVYIIGEGKLTMGALIGAVILLGRAMAPISSLTGLAVRFQQARTALGMLNKVMATPTDREEGRNYLHKPKLTGNLATKELAFSYGQDLPLAINGVDLQIAPGERIAILGRIGSGKSTLLKLLSGLYRAQKGSVIADGVDIQQIEPADLRRNVLYVSQEARLFYGTLRENLKAGNPRADDDMMVKVATAFGVNNFAASHPRGYDMMIGEQGVGLSGGQRQAVALARAVLTNPAVLLLDEPTSAMDNGSEQVVMQALMQFGQDKTVIFVTHKLQLLNFVERVIVIDAGVRVADGPKHLVMQALSEGRVKGVPKAVSGGKE